MENTYGIGIANRYELFYDQDDVTEFETVITKKKEKKSKEPAQQTQASSPAVGVQKSTAEKENKQVKKALDNGAGLKPSPDQQRRGIKEQQNNSNKDNSLRKDGGKLPFMRHPFLARPTRPPALLLLFLTSLFWKIFHDFLVESLVCA
jgi:hypothetical protein